MSIFQWLGVPLPIAAYWASRRVWFALQNCLPMVIIGRQYYRIPTAIRHGDSAAVRLYATVGAVPFGIMVFILQDWRYRAPTTELR